MLIELALKSCELHHVRFDVEEIQFGIGYMLCTGIVIHTVKGFGSQ